MELPSTSHVERLNATTRLHVKRLSPLTLAFSKKLENFKAAVALPFAYYNLVRRHATFRCTPAIAPGIERRLLDYERSGRGGIVSYIQELRDVIRRLHGAEPTHIESVPVLRSFTAKQFGMGSWKYLTLQAIPRLTEFTHGRTKRMSRTHQGTLRYFTSTP